MKQLSKIMLAAVASVALAAPAFGWDFGASGSSTATYTRSTSNTGALLAEDVVANGVTSSGGGISISSSHADGANSATLTYSLDFDSDAAAMDLNESFSLSGSKKVGKWTGSSATTQYIQDASDATGARTMGANSSAVITLTDGTITYKLGSAAHLSTAEKAVNGPMDGAQDAEARVDSFNGFSVGLGVGPGTLTVAIDEGSGATPTALGEDNTGIACGSQAMGFGFNFSGDVGADLSFTYGSSSASADAACGDNNTSDAATANTMGLGVAVPIGGMSLALDYESSGTTNTQAKVETVTAGSGFEISFTMPLSDATLGLNVSSHANETTVGGVVTALGAAAGTELWYTVPIGPVGLSIGYGSSATASGCATCGVDGAAVLVTTATKTQMGAEMTMSF